MSTNTITITSEQPKELCDEIYKVLRGEAAFAPPNWKDIVLQTCTRCVVHAPSEAEQCAFPTASAAPCPLRELRREILSDADWQQRVETERRKINK
jgi:hypothetical protein